MRLALVLAAAALGLSCGPSFKPGTYVEGMRILSIRAEPPDLAVFSFFQRELEPALVAFVAQHAGFGRARRTPIAVETPRALAS